MAEAVLISSRFDEAAAFLKLGGTGDRGEAQLHSPPALVPTCLSGEELSASLPQRPWPISRLRLRHTGGVAMGQAGTHPAHPFWLRRCRGTHAPPI